MFSELLALGTARLKPAQVLFLWCRQEWHSRTHLLHSEHPELEGTHKDRPSPTLISWGASRLIGDHHPVFLESSGLTKVVFQLMAECFKAQDLFTSSCLFTPWSCWEVLERLGTFSGTGYVLIQFPALQFCLCDLGTCCSGLSAPTLHHHPRWNGNPGVSFFPSISGRSFPTGPLNAFGIDLQANRLKTY